MRGFATLPDVGIPPEDFTKLGLKGSGGEDEHPSTLPIARGRKIHSALNWTDALNWTKIFTTNDGSRVQVRPWCRVLIVIFI